MRYRLNRHTDIYFVERSWRKQARWLIPVIVLLGAIMLSGCSVGPRSLNPNLDAPRKPENVNIIRHELYVLPANFHCAYHFADRGLYGASAAMIAGTALGGFAAGCGTVTLPPPRKPMRVDATDIVMVQSERCTKETCRCEIYYMWDPFGWVEHDEYMHCLGYIDQHPKVADLGYDESLFEKDSDR